MIWRIRNIINKMRNKFRLKTLTNGGFHKLKNISRNNIRKDNEKKMSVDRGIKKYEKRQLDYKGKREYKFFNLSNIIILSILFITLIFIHVSGYSVTSLYLGIFIFISITLYLLIVERFKENVEVKEEINEIKNDKEKENNNFLDKVKEIEEIEKNRIEHIILKNSEDYDIKIWKIGRSNSLLIGKHTHRNKVDIDISEGIYSNLVSRAHGVLNKSNGTWYYEDLGSQNGSGIEKKSDKRKIKIKKHTPIKVETGDIIYLATTKILLK